MLCTARLDSELDDLNCENYVSTTATDSILWLFFFRPSVPDVIFMHPRAFRALHAYFFPTEVAHSKPLIGCSL